MKSTTVGIALNHDFEVCLVNHIHFLLAVFVAIGQFLAANDTVQLSQVMRNNPVQRNVGEWCLSTPTRGGVDAVNKGLDALLDFLIGEFIFSYEGSQIGIERRECLGTRCAL